MGAGTFPAGVGPSGADPSTLSSAPPGARAPVALKYDPSIRGFVQDADGSMDSVHPVDQQVALALFLREGSVAGAETVGNRFRQRLSRVSPLKIAAVAVDETKYALRRVIARKDILLLSVDVEANDFGRVLLAVGYVNTRVPTYNPNNPGLSARVLSGAIAT